LSFKGNTSTQKVILEGLGDVSLSRGDPDSDAERLASLQVCGLSPEPGISKGGRPLPLPGQVLRDCVPEGWEMQTQQRQRRWGQNKAVSGCLITGLQQLTAR